jgi:outer membrane protein OmpA-like peptidoglycan-associated protein
MVSGRIRRALLILPLGLALGCTEPDATPTTETTAQPSTTTSPDSPDLSGVAYDLLHLATHPNGAQLVIDRIEVFTDSTVVIGHLINGSPFELRIGGGETRLVRSDGSTLPETSGMTTTRVQPTEELDLVMRFGAVDEGETLILQFNWGGGSSPSNPSSSVPSFELGPMRLDPAASRPALPEPLAAVASTSTPMGIELVVEGVNFTETRIGVLARISNPTGVEARISPTAAPCVIVDDLGNRYFLVLPEGEGFLTIPAGGAVSGILVFGGRVHPDATRFTIALNAGASHAAVGGRILPELVIRDLSLSGTTGLAPLPRSLESSDAVQHPNGVEVSLRSVSFNATGMEAAVTIANGRSESVALAASGTFVRDDTGNLYPLVVLPGNPQLVVDANTTVEATLGFSGRIADAATDIVLHFNAEGSADDPATRRPAFSFGPLELVRDSVAVEPAVPAVFPVGLRTRLGPADLVVSQVDRITETLREFDATQVDGGFRLTLPESILFDFGSADLRPDSRPALDLIAEVLAYYADATVIVVGHTDSIGSESANQALSERRASSVLDRLVNDHGIARDRLTAEGRGESEPVAPNTHPDGSDNPEGRQLNRRVEIVVLTDEPVQLP